MMLSIADVLSTAEVDDARAALHAARFFDGRASAGWAGQVVKVNKQAHEGDETVDALRDLIVERLQSSPVPIGSASEARAGTGILPLSNVGRVWSSCRRAGDGRCTQ